MLLLEAGASRKEATQFELCWLAGASTAAIRALLDRRVVVRTLRHDEGDTPLHVAAAHARDVGVFDLLVNECGVPLEKRNDDGETCVHAAVRGLNAVALRWLIAAGAELNRVSQLDRSTPLSANSDYECATLVLAGGAAVESCIRTRAKRWVVDVADLTCARVDRSRC